MICDSFCDRARRLQRPSNAAVSCCRLGLLLCECACVIHGSGRAGVPAHWDGQNPSAPQLTSQTPRNVMTDRILNGLPARRPVASATPVPNPPPAGVGQRRGSSYFSHTHAARAAAHCRSGQLGAAYRDRGLQAAAASPCACREEKSPLLLSPPRSGNRRRGPAIAAPAAATATARAAPAALLAAAPAPALRQRQPALPLRGRARER